MLKVLINCPGGWSHGLDSPERGEGRWAQNLARCLARSGRYEVSACSGGVPTWGRGVVEPNVELLSEQDARRRGPYDMYFDAAWYDKKVPAAEACHSFHVHFGYEPRLGIRFPERHYLVYVLANSGPNYAGEGRDNADRTFFLPAPFGATMATPDPSKRQVIHTMRGSDAPGRRERFELVYDAVTRLRGSMSIPFTWLSSDGLERPRHADDRVIPVRDGWGIPYCEIRALLAESGLNLAIDGWSNVLDSTALGVASLAWDNGIGPVDPNIGRVGAEHDLLLTPQSRAGDITDAIGWMFSDPGKYTAYVQSMQAAYADHVDARTMECFDAIVKSVGA